MVDGINNIASQIFSKLDSQDSKGSDNKIEASIWNKFVSDKGGKEISNYIKKENAVKSIISYLTNMSKKLGCTVEELANRWLGVDKTSIDESKYDKSENDLSIKYHVLKTVPKSKYDEKTGKIIPISPEEGKAKLMENQKLYDESVGLLMDVANGKYKKFKTQLHGNQFDIELKDGREISIILEKSKYSGKYKVREVCVDLDRSKSFNDCVFMLYDGIHEVRPNSVNIEYAEDIDSDEVKDIENVAKIILQDILPEGIELE